MPRSLQEKGQEQLFAAVVADGACEAMGKQTAREVAPKFVLHVARQALARALVGMQQEALEVLLNDAIQNGALRSALLVRPAFAAGHGARTSAIAVPRRGCTPTSRNTPSALASARRFCWLRQANAGAVSAAHWNVYQRLLQAPARHRSNRSKLAQ